MLKHPMVAGAVCVGLWLSSSVAFACGGLFCDNSQPVNQDAERIIFSDNPDDTVTAVVQIQYEGPSERFSWVLPVPSVPEIGVSSNAAFARLQALTNPRYNLRTEVEGECRQDDFINNTNNANNFNNANNAANNGVNVLASGSVGPYDYDVIEVEGMPGDPVQVVLDWLSTNGYDVSTLAPGLIGEYLNMGMKFVAFRLSKEKDAGDIRPVMLTYDSLAPMIPIKLTAVATNPDMGILVWVIGDARAVPTNYKDLVLNEALIDWWSPARNYDQVVAIAANEAGGQGFVTEHATSARDIELWDEFDQQEWELVQGYDESPDWIGSAWALSGFGTFDGWEDAIDLIFADETDAIRSQIKDGQQLDIESFDPALATSTLSDLVIRPLIDTQGLFARTAKVTRMYTTMSAEEMTLDPVFEFNPTLPDYNNIHLATATIECNPTVYFQEASYRVTLPNGDVVRGSTQGLWPLNPGGDLPSNEKVQQQNTTGSPEVVTDNSDAIGAALDAHNAGVPETVLELPDEGQNNGNDGNNFEPEEPATDLPGCATGAVTPNGLLLMMLALVFVRLRKRE